jgi:hypothetical protein
MITVGRKSALSRLTLSFLRAGNVIKDGSFHGPCVQEVGSKNGFRREYLLCPQRRASSFLSGSG